MLTQRCVDGIGRKIIVYATEVHKEPGYGLYEGIYETYLSHLLIQQSQGVKSQNKAPIVFKGIEKHAYGKIGLSVGDLIKRKLKSAESVLPVNEAHLLTNMKLLKKPKGILICLNCRSLFYKDHISRVNEFDAAQLSG